MATDLTRGLDCKLLYSTTVDAHNDGAATWLELERIENLSISVSGDEVTANAKNSNFTYKAKTFISLSLTFDYLANAYNVTDGDFDNLKGSFLSSTPLCFYVADGSYTAGTEGWTFVGEVFGFDQVQDAGAVVRYSVRVEPVRAINGSGNLITPNWYVKA